MRTKWMAQAPVKTCQHAILAVRGDTAELQTFGIDPFRVEVGQGGLVTDVLQRLRGLSVHQTARPSPPCRLGVHTGSWLVCMSPLIRRTICVSGKAKAGGWLKECRRQLGGI